MRQPSDQGREQKRSALTTLSTVGAALAGVGVGALLWSTLGPIGWAIVVVGLVAHLFGMVGTRRVQSAEGYKTPAWQQIAYWLCWALIAIIGLYLLVEAGR